MVGRPSPMFNLLLAKAAQKKNSPKGCPTKKLGSSPRGNTAEGTYNFTSTQPLQNPLLRQVENTNENDLDNTEVVFPNFEETVAYDVQDVDAEVQRNEDEDANVEMNEHRLQRRPATISRHKEAKEPKRPKKSSNIGLMERYLDMKTKQAEEEAARLEAAEAQAREKEAAEAQLAREKEEAEAQRA